MARSGDRPSRSSKRRAREGAVAVEALVVISTLALGFAWSLYMQRLSTAKLEGLYDARQQAWNEALAGCGAQGGFDLKSAVTSFAQNDDVDPADDQPFRYVRTPNGPTVGGAFVEWELR